MKKYLTFLDQLNPYIKYSYICTWLFILLNAFYDASFSILILGVTNAYALYLYLQNQQFYKLIGYHEKLYYSLLLSNGVSLLLLGLVNPYISEILVSILVINTLVYAILLNQKYFKLGVIFVIIIWFTEIISNPLSYKLEYIMYELLLIVIVTLLIRRVNIETQLSKIAIGIILCGIWALMIDETIFYHTVYYQSNISSLIRVCFLLLLIIILSNLWRNYFKSNQMKLIYLFVMCYTTYKYAISSYYIVFDVYNYQNLDGLLKVNTISTFSIILVLLILMVTKIDQKLFDNKQLKLRKGHNEVKSNP